MNFCRSLGANPSALPLRSRFRNSLVPYSSSHLPVFTAPRRSPMMIGRCWMPTGHWNSQAPQWCIGKQLPRRYACRRCGSVPFAP